MSFSGKRPPTEAPQPANLAPDEMATNQQATAIPLVMGTNKVALRWITPALNQFTRPAPTKRPGKK